ncbi:MAG: metal-sensitive transcriptional regulator [Candidatus Gracilibacteria bacterium]|nr:metal-sensitive transcriptional regulator [Candidatus Peregrinibacteria bacterium]
MDRRRKKTVKDKALHRVKIIQGHLRKIEQMLEDNVYCVDVVHQSRAVQSALKKVDLLLIEDHLKNCHVHHIQSGQTEKATSELLTLFNYK